MPFLLVKPALTLTELKKKAYSSDPWYPHLYHEDVKLYLNYCKFEVTYNSYIVKIFCPWSQAHVTSCLPSIDTSVLRQVGKRTPKSWAWPLGKMLCSFKSQKKPNEADVVSSL